MTQASRTAQDAINGISVNVKLDGYQLRAVRDVLKALGATLAPFRETHQPAAYEDHMELPNGRRVRLYETMLDGGYTEVQVYDVDVDKKHKQTCYESTMKRLASMENG